MVATVGIVEANSKFIALIEKVQSSEEVDMKRVGKTLT